MATNGRFFWGMVCDMHGGPFETQADAEKFAKIKASMTGGQYTVFEAKVRFEPTQVVTQAIERKKL